MRKTLPLAYYLNLAWNYAVSAASYTKKQKAKELLLTVAKFRSDSKRIGLYFFAVPAPSTKKSSERVFIMELTTKNFAIQDWIDFDAKGRAACPSCELDGKRGQKNLFVKADGKYWCYRGCTPEQIREVLGAPPPGQPINRNYALPPQTHNKKSVVPPSSAKPRTVPNKQALQALQRLLSVSAPFGQQALDWLIARGFNREMIQHYRLGLDRRWITLDENKPNSRECYWSISIYIPSEEPGQFYKKMRVAPWLVGDARPDYVGKWCQYGVPATIWFTYLPDDATETWFVEGEWDAMRLGWLARQHRAKVAICCSTTGCSTIPKPEQLNRLPGKVTIFFDRNDEPRTDGTLPGDEGAKKLALALGDRGLIALVPMPENCQVQGWDVSNALDAGYTWSDFETAAVAAVPPPQPISNRTQGQHSNTPNQTQPAATMSLRDLILDILNRHDNQSLRDIALMELARATGYAYRDIDKLAKSLAVEVDLQTDQVEAAKKLKELIKTRRTQLDLNRYLEPWFAATLIETAQAMPTAPEFLFTTLLAAAASRMGTAARVAVKISAKYTQPMVFWTAIVANSGSMKTPAQRVILDPLVALETQAYESYILETADYKAQTESRKRKKPDVDSQEESIKAPTRQRYLTKDITLETLQRIHGENPRGILYYRDELAGNIKARNQYRGGKGADEEAELDQWNGSAILYDRAEKSVCLPRSGISRTGGYQWEILANLMGDHKDFNGGFARWLFCAAKTPPRYLNLMQEEQDTGITEALTHLYIELEKIPEQDYLLSFEAKQLFETWQHQLVDAELAEDSVGLQLACPKVEAYTARLALWLHVVNAVLRGEKPSQVISGETMNKAIELAAYYLWQYRLIHTHNSPDSGLAALGLKIQKFTERVGQVTASKLKSGIRALKKTAIEQIRTLMQTLAENGYGRTIGVGSDMVYIPVAANNSPQAWDEPSEALENCQFVNSTVQKPVKTAINSVDAPRQSGCQLSTEPFLEQEQLPQASEREQLEPKVAKVDPPPGEGAFNSGIDWVAIASDSVVPVNEIDIIDTPLTLLSTVETGIQQVSQDSIDAIAANCAPVADGENAISNAAEMPTRLLSSLCAELAQQYLKVMAQVTNVEAAQEFCCSMQQLPPATQRDILVIAPVVMRERLVSLMAQVQLERWYNGQLIAYGSRVRDISALGVYSWAGFVVEIGDGNCVVVGDDGVVHLQVNICQLSVCQQPPAIKDSSS